MDYRHRSDKPGTWKRIKTKNFYADVHLVKQLQSGEIEIRDKTPKQAAQNIMWQLQGRMLALASAEDQLVKELREQYPKHFKKLSHRDIINEFYADVTIIDMGLLLKKYCPDLFKQSEPT